MMSDSLGAIEWSVIGLLVVLSLAIGVWNNKRGHVTGKTKSSLLQLSISTIVTFSSTIAMLGVPSQVRDYFDFSRRK